MNEMVKLKMPLTRSEKEAVYVAVNGESWLIQRGQEVEIPWYVAKVLERQEKTLNQALEFEEKAARPVKEMEKRA